MSKSEDYLDQLLKGVNQQGDTDVEEDFFEEDFLGEDLLNEDLLNEDILNDDVSEDFLKEFEMEMADITGEEEASESVEDLFEDLDSIVSGAKEQMEAVEETVLSESDGAENDFSVEDFSYDDIGSDIGELEAESAKPADLAEPVAEEPQIDDGEADVMKILEGLGDIDLGLEDEMGGETTEQSEESKANDDALLSFLTGGAMAGESSSESSESEVESFAFEEEPAKDDKKSKKDKKKPAKTGEKAGFFNKLGTILFGEDEEEEEAAAKAAAKQPEASAKPEAKIEEFSDATLDLFKDFTTTPSEPAAAAPVETEDKKKGKKKKEKKEKKEKVKKEKKPKPKKEKKPKKPKEPDNTPPLPKKPVFLIFLMVGSLLALIIVGTNLTGYSNGMNSAKNAYAKQNYTEAYSYVAGMEIKDKDVALFEKYQTMALVASEYDAYETLMKGEFYDMALDSLIRMLGRCEKYRADAETYGCIKELNALELEAENKLSETFSMTKEEALELYDLRDRRDYSKALNEVLKELGMEKVTEE